MKRSPNAGQPFFEKKDKGSDFAKLVKLTGIIAPEKWGVKNQMQQLALHTFDEGKYLLIAKSVDDKLREKIYEIVSLKCRIDIDELGRDVAYVVAWHPSK